MHQRILSRLLARLAGRPLPPSFESGGIAIAQPATKGTRSSSRGVGVKGWRAFFYRRDAAAIMMTAALWLTGLYLRPDFWGSLDNTFNLALAFMMHELGADPVSVIATALVVGTLAGVVNEMLAVRFGMPAFVATLGMFYIARGIGAWLSAGSDACAVHPSPRHPQD